MTTPALLALVEELRVAKEAANASAAELMRAKQAHEARIFLCKEISLQITEAIGELTQPIEPARNGFGPPWALG